MEAVVAMVNKQKRLAAVKTADGEYTIFKIIERFSIEVGDIISHKDFSTSGLQLYENMSKKKIINVKVECISRSLEHARKIFV